MPAPAEPLFQAAVANLNPWTEAKVDTETSDRGPLLIVSGEKDHTVPPVVANAAYERQAPQRGRDRDRRDTRTRPRAHDRSRLAGGRRDRPCVRAEVRLNRRPARKTRDQPGETLDRLPVLQKTVAAASWKPPGRPTFSNVFAISRISPSQRHPLADADRRADPSRSRSSGCESAHSASRASVDAESLGGLGDRDQERGTALGPRRERHLERRRRRSARAVEDACLGSRPANSAATSPAWGPDSTAGSCRRRLAAGR